MTDGFIPSDPASRPHADNGLHPRFDVVPGTGQQPATVRAAGDIDLTSAPRLQAALEEAAATTRDIVADLTAVTYCDSAAIHALFSVAQRSHLTLIIPATGPINAMLKITGLDQIATVTTRQPAGQKAPEA
jgi:anti-sigma B factor antagonist